MDEVTDRPFYQWIFRTSLEERRNQPNMVYGDTIITASRKCSDLGEWERERESDRVRRVCKCQDLSGVTMSLILPSLSLVHREQGVLSQE